MHTTAKVRRITTHLYFPIVCLLILNLSLGLIFVTDFGETRDELFRYRYAERSISAYFGAEPGKPEEKGPFYVMLAKVGSDIFKLLNNNWKIIDGWHMMHFLSFLWGIFFFYVLCLQIVGKWASFGATLLFNAQPLLLGHSLINPKDIPFMSFFISSVALGFLMVVALSTDQSRRGNNLVDRKEIEESPLQYFIDDWNHTPKFNQWLFPVVGFLLCALVLGLIVYNPYMQSQLSLIIKKAYNAGSSDIIGQLFNRFADFSGEVPLEKYVDKGLILYSRNLFFLISALFVFYCYFIYRVFPKTVEWFWIKKIQPFIKQVAFSLINPKILSAGIVVGLCTSIRVLGLAAGLIIGIYILLKISRRAIPALLAYTLIAFTATYVTWPDLWGSPVRKLFQSFNLAVNFPWNGKVMFAGVEYTPSALPWFYLPSLISLQLTETAILMFFIGLIFAVIALRDHYLEWEKFIVIALWLFGPLIAVAIIRPNMYDNFRQFLFIIPPIFVICGIGLQGIYSRIKSFAIRLIFMLVLLVPSLYGIVNLHPYQYVYYNKFVGGIQGAFRQYEMDYWAASYKEAAEYLNGMAPQNASVIVWGPDHIVERYARDDLSIVKYHMGDDKDTPLGSYVILSSRLNKDINLYSSAEELNHFGRDGAVYTVVKVVSSND
jgi:hypothetical protein